MSFAKRFKELRLKNNYSMQAIGEKAGVGKSSIAAYESGEKKPTTDRLTVLAEILGVSTDYLLGLSDDPYTPKQTRNLAILLKESNDFHYNGIPLSNEDLGFFNTVLEKLLKDVREDKEKNSDDKEN
ncbi:helix-turn-helix domain-containing protein [Peribacillus frigoritolerans]|uniref:helix-turn-helix domain-containing protein n=1 Tax=Peribacillus frigoritolerans TaxID=450367 RepID=UPI00207A9996|nr:helix-turn-helix transcriptional regulator [Peribacillus frigoritolerans]USK77729.1 helix-turn-helix transcriptional regulator [Peribacillus frigoritolerans]USK77807.1 helix-turn-helix transcriptional regulator [Peribacillus frigoritolerans]USK77861.1 helix-turn-helix transcriptional regulator [Peribacillus frigoritolerans]